MFFKGEGLQAKLSWWNVCLAYMKHRVLAHHIIHEAKEYMLTIPALGSGNGEMGSSR